MEAQKPTKPGAEDAAPVPRARAASVFVFIIILCCVVWLPVWSWCIPPSPSHFPLSAPPLTAPALAARFRAQALLGASLSMTTWVEVVEVEVRNVAAARAVAPLIACCRCLRVCSQAPCRACAESAAFVLTLRVATHNIVAG
jgi:hypothetical protein